MKWLVVLFGIVLRNGFGAIAFGKIANVSVFFLTFQLVKMKNCSLLNHRIEPIQISGKLPRKHTVLESVKYSSKFRLSFANWMYRMLLLIKDEKFYVVNDSVGYT